MEARKITVVLNNKSSQKTIMSTAETLGQLKREMNDAGIMTSGMAFYEGRTRTELKDDQSVLPTNVPVPAKGTTPASTTNELVFMLTPENKKVKSGALGTERSNILAEIKAKGLGKAVMEKFKKNATQVSSKELTAFLEEIDNKENKPKSAKAPKAEAEALPVDEAPSQADIIPTVVAGVDIEARKLLNELIETLRGEDELYEDYSGLADRADELANGADERNGHGGCSDSEEAAPKEEGLSREEIDDIFSFVRG